MSTIPDDKPLSLYVLIFLILLDSLSSFYGFFEKEFLYKVGSLIVSGAFFYAFYKMLKFKHDAPEFASKLYFARAIFLVVCIPFTHVFVYRLSIAIYVFWSFFIVFWLSRKSVRMHYRRLGFFMQFNDPKQNEEHFN